MDHLHKLPHSHGRLQFRQRTVRDECHPRTSTLNTVQHNLILQVRSKDMLLLGTQ